MTTAAELLDILLKLAALLGAVLGVYNFVKARQAERVRLNVDISASRAKGYDQEGRVVQYSTNRSLLVNDDMPDHLRVKVVNQSSFRVVVDEIGFYFDGTDARSAVYDPPRDKDVPWPCAIEPRDSASFYLPFENVLRIQNIDSLRACYVSTACGTTKEVRNVVIKEIARLKRVSSSSSM